MNFFRKLFSTGRPNNRFNRYYGNIAHKGVGYPTADEARRDMAQQERHSRPFGWPV